MMGGLTSVAATALWGVLIVALVCGAYALLLLLRAGAQEPAQAATQPQPEGKGKKGKEPPPDPLQEVQALLKASVGAYPQFLTASAVVLVFSLLMAATVLIIPPLKTLVFQQATPLSPLWVAAIAAARAGGFLVGAVLVSVAVWPGVRASAGGAVRTAAAARKGYGSAMQAAHRAGAVAPMLTASLGGLASVLIFLVPGGASADLFAGFVAGVVVMAFFWRVGGSLVAGASVVGSEIVGRTGTQSGSDDPHDPATLAAMASESAEGSASTAADLFESTEVTFVATLLLGVLFAHASVGTLFDGPYGERYIILPFLYDERYIIFPFLLRGIGLVASLIGNITVRTDDQRRNAIGAMKRGRTIALVLSISGLAGGTLFFMKNPATGVVDWRPFIAALTGFALLFVLSKVAEHFTSTRFSPVKQLSNTSQMGTPSGLLSGLSAGSEASAWTALSLVVALAVSGLLYANEPATTRLLATFYCVTLSGMGMLSLNGYMLSLGGFGSVAHNAHRIGTMANLDKNPRNTLEDLDAIGSMTRAITRGVAAGAVLVTLVALVVLFASTTSLLYNSTLPHTLFSAGPLFLVGLLTGSGLPFLFSNLATRSVIRGAAQFVNQARQGQQNPPAGSDQAPLAASQVVRTVARATQRDLLALGAIALLVPLIVGLLIGIAGLGGLLVGLLLSGPMLATSQAYAGGAWGNARKAIEEGFFGGKNSEAHRGAVLGNAIGAPLRDAIGPALHSLMTLAGVVVLVVLPASVVLRLSDIAGSPLLLGALAVCVALLVAAILYVKREGEPMSPVRRLKTVVEEVRGAFLVLVVAVVGAVAFAWGGSGSLKAIQPLRSLDMLPIAVETPSPTATATPQATTTPWPTYTPFPTYTPPPTYTPLPTYTPVAASPTLTAAITATEQLAPTVAIPEIATPAPEQPATDTPAPAPETTTHTVQPGDTLATIAEQYNTTISALMEANNLTPAQANSLQVGQELIIPAP